MAEAQKHRTAREVVLIARATQAERQAQWDRVDEGIRKMVAFSTAAALKQIKADIAVRRIVDGDR